ncbi:MAG TPA: hypothetical protein VGS27_08310 [Candidatus Sulfotelmatobacter sp.]|nr:hypothetical protein [Candidatus Sulfotelmatobacter sp.]
MVQSRVRKLVIWMAIAAGGVTTVAVHAQEHDSAPSAPAPILMTVREIPQPGAEAAHAKLEADYAAALDAGKGRQYYLGMGAITGAPQTLFLSGYSSMEEMSDVHDHDEVTMGEKMASLEEEHSGTLAGEDTAIWRLRPELSNPPTVNLATMRFMELVHIHVKLGHRAEFADVINHIREGWIKADPDFHYSIYQQTFGSSIDDSYLVEIPMKSLADLDKRHSMVAEYRKDLGEDVEKRLLEFESSNYNSIESNLFAFTPSMSRLPPSWTKDDEFWKPQHTVPVPAKKAAKPK